MKLNPNNVMNNVFKVDKTFVINRLVAITKLFCKSKIKGAYFVAIAKRQANFLTMATGSSVRIDIDDGMTSG